MESIKGIFRIGRGPSSSHTMGPEKAAKIFASRHPHAHHFQVILYGSLAATGKGHMTDVAITEVLQPIAPTSIIWKPKVFLPFHPNAMKFISFSDQDQQSDEWTVYSIGGGALSEGKGDDDFFKPKQVYEMNTLSQILDWCEKNGRDYWEYVEICEGKQIWDFLDEVWMTMQASVRRGINHEGRLPGPLNLRRKAPSYFVKTSRYKPELQGKGLIFSYALAVSEENASGNTIVTAPTCGASGVLPGILYYLNHDLGYNETKILHALATAGIFGNVVKQNASISGAEVGCQGEVGVACAMAAAAGCQLYGGTPSQIEYAAEMGLEHHLGMTCDPVCGLVQIPCIERNAFAASRAMDAQVYANLSDGRHVVSFDRVVRVMQQTGHDLPSLYKETSMGGLAKSDL